MADQVVRTTVPQVAGILKKFTASLQKVQVKQKVNTKTEVNRLVDQKT